MTKKRSVPLRSNEGTESLAPAPAQRSAGVRPDKAAVRRDRLLDAAEQVMTRAGLLGMTLEAVAAEAATSKGGLLYHFASKRELVKALVARRVGRMTERYEVAMAGQPPQPGRTVGAFLASMPKEGSSEERALRRMTSSLLAARVEFPELLRPAQDLYRRILRDVHEDGGDPGVALLTIAAVDGVWLSELLGLYRLKSDQRKALERAVDALWRGDVPARPPSGSPSTGKRP